MLDYNVLKNKPTISIDNEETIDLLYKTIDYVDNGEEKGQFLQVNEYYIARPDLISLACYGDDKYADILCKLNGISNPFELNEGMILFIPTFEYMTSIIDQKSKFKITNKIEDNDTIALNQKIGAQKQKNEKRSPSQQLVGDVNYVIDKSLGVVFY